ncbi:MAG: DUF1573 domain-containing protein [Bacteroidales bacterium]|nr:DUF1573 domain-containing protein [Bacteroidales bacterium]
MKRIFLIVTLFLFASSLVMAQDEADKNPNAPEITFEKTTHDYGTIHQNDDGTCEFEFTNTGKEPLVLSRVRSSCGCTVPTWPRKPILPGKTEVIEVKYNTHRIGRINKSVTVMSNAKNSPVVLRIKGKVVPKSQKIGPEKDVDKESTPISG